MLIGRGRELEFLEAAHSYKELKLLILYGRQGVGKTSLLQAFKKGKRGLYYTIRPVGSVINKELFAKELQAQAYEAKDSSSWKNLLKPIFLKAKGERLFLIFDQIQEFDKYGEDFFLDLLSLIKENQQARLTIILAGQRGSWLDQVARHSPKPDILHLRPLSFIEAQPFYDSFSQEERVLLYGLTDGLPGILQLLRKDYTIKENLLELFYQPHSPLKEWGYSLTNNFRQPHLYHTIMYAIAQGKQRLGAIGQYIGLECNKLSKYMQVLLEQGFIERVVSEEEFANGRQPKRTMYILSSTLLLFWYKYVFPYVGAIEQGQGNSIIRHRLQPQLDWFLEQAFVGIVGQYAQLLQERRDYPHSFSSLNKVWRSKEDDKELFLLSQGKGKACALYSCWHKQKLDERELAALTEGRPYDFTMVFSRKGFTDKALSFSSSREQLRLISLVYLK